MRMRMYDFRCSVFILLFVLLFIPQDRALSKEGEEGMKGSIRYQDRWAIVPEWSGTPVIDGRLTEAMWQKAATLDGFTTAFHENPLQQEVVYKLGYDNDYLYIGARMAPDEASTLSQIEIVMQAGAKDSHHVAVIPIHPRPDLSLRSIWNIVPDEVDLTVDPGRRNIEAIYSLVEEPGEFFVEAAIPLAAISPEGVAAGDEWQLNIIHIHNLYTSPLSSWVPIRNTYHWHEGGKTARLYGSVIDQDRLGHLYFSRLPEQTEQPVNEIEIWQPHETDTKFLYHGFTNKQMTFSLPLLNSGGKGGYGGLETSDIQLYWKEPGLSWKQLSDVSFARNGPECTLEFAHPKPLTDGIYHLKIVLSPKPATLKRVAILTFDREGLVAGGLSLYDSSESANTGQPQVPVTWTPELSADVKRIMALIPPQPGFNYVGLPEMPELYPQNLYQLSADGHSLIAPRTGTVYPNEQFKEDKQLVVTNGNGETVTIPYYEDAEGNRYFITAHMWYLQKKRAIAETAALAKRDPLGAAQLLYRFAQVYEGYQPTVDRVSGNNHINHVASISSGPPYAYWGGIWERWYLNDLPQIRPLLQAYNDVKQTNAFELLSDHEGIDVEQEYVRKMFTSSADFVLSFVNRYGNLSFRPWHGLVTLGKALNEPDYIHRVITYVEDFASRMFLADGFWKEVTLSYHLQTVDELASILEELRGWSDPEWYTSPRTGIRLDDLDMEHDYPIIGKAIEMANRLVYPDGKVLPIMDTWANRRMSQPQTNEGSLLLPYAGVARLTGGIGDSQTQVYMGFQPKYGHIHYDPLNLSLYAQGQELLPDIGYSHNTNYRWFVLSTMGHNTVVVDGSNMSNNENAIHGGNVQAFVSDDDAFRAARASYESAYPSTEEYSREPRFVPFPDGTGEQGYVLDLFRVSGGSRHEYTLQGDANRDARFITDLPLADYGPYLLPPGTRVVEPVSNNDSGKAEGHYPGYIYVRDVQQAELGGDQYALTLATEQDGAELAKMKITGLLEPGNNELYLGRSPSLRASRLNGISMDNNDEAEKYTMPKMVLRREGTNLRSTFITVLEPYRGQDARIEAIDRLPMDHAPEGAVAIRVAYGDTVDILLSNPHNPEAPLVVGDMTMIGEMGFIRLENGQVKEMKLVGGTRLQKGDRILSGSGTIRGAIMDVWRKADGDLYDAILTDVPVPAEMIGNFVMVEHPDGTTHGFEIGDIRRERDQTVLVLAEHDPGFTIRDDGTSRQTSFPGKRWTGGHSFTIQGVNHADGLGGEEPVPQVEALQYVRLHAAQRHLLAGQTVQLEVYGVMSDGTVAPLRTAERIYSSSNPDVLAVDAAGQVTARVDGSARLAVEVTLGNVTRSAAMMMSAQAIAGGEQLREPPVLQVSDNSVFPRQPVELAIGGDVLWRDNISGISINGITVGEAVYTILDQKIIVSPEQFRDEGDYWILIRSPGYRDAAVEQRIVSRAALSDLQVRQGSLIPVFDPRITEYAVRINADTDMLYVSPFAYDPDAVIEVAGQTYESGDPIPIVLTGDPKQVIALKVTAADQSTKAYMFTVYREPDTRNTGIITGIVYDTANVPLSGVKVNLTGYSTIQATTDAAGRFTLTQVPVGLHRVTAQAAGYVREVSEAVRVYHGQAIGVAIRFTHSLPPSLLDALPLGVKSGDPIGNTSSKHGYLYLVPNDTPKSKEEIEAAASSTNGRMAKVEANVAALFDTSGLPTGLYKMYAIDSSGLISVGSDTIVIIDPQTQGGSVDDDNPIVRYSGKWTLYESANYWGGSLMLSNEKSAYVDIPFYGTSAKVLSTLSRARGVADIYVDGVYRLSVDTYRSGNQYQREIFDTGSLPPGVHIVRIVVTGERNPEASNNQITFDALIVY